MLRRPPGSTARSAVWSTLTRSAFVTCSVIAMAACGSSDDSVDSSSADVATSDGSAETTDQEELFPDVVGVTAQRADDGTWTFSVTLSSPYDTPARYADAWRVVGPDGTVYGVRDLAHDHQNEQPFTRSLSGVEIPDGVDQVTVEGRDQVSGWGGETLVHRLET